MISKIDDHPPGDAASANDMNADSSQVVVIGGGLAGLTTAFYLHRQGIRTTLLESSARLGGALQTTRHQGWLIDHGADMFAVSPPGALALCQDLGISHELIHANVARRGAMIVRDGRPYPIPEGFVLMRPTNRETILATQLLSAEGKNRVLAEGDVSPRLDVDQANQPVDESVSDFVRRRFGEELLNRVVQPLVGGIYTADTNRLSMNATMRSFVEMERQHGSLDAATQARMEAGIDSVERSSAGARYEQFRGFPDGMQRLIDALQDATVDTDCRLNCLVKRVTNVVDDQGRSSSWRVETNRGSIRSEHVVIATPARSTAELLRPLCSPASELLDAIPMASSAVVVLGVRKEDIQAPVDAFGIVVPICEQRNCLAISFASYKFPGRTPNDDHVLIRVFIGGMLQPELFDEDDQRLVEIAMGDLRDLIGLKGSPVVRKVVRWKSAMPQYHLGHVRRIAEIRDHVAAFSGLHLVGNTYDGVGIAPTIRLAKRVADSIGERIRGRG